MILKIVKFFILYLAKIKTIMGISLIYLIWNIAFNKNSLYNYLLIILIVIVVL